MRPIQHPPLVDLDRPGVPATAYLLQAYGPYCSISERLLPDLAHAWNCLSGEEQEAVHGSDDWRELLLLDPATFAAWLRSDRSRSEELLLPHRDATFSLGEGSPFRYDLEEISVLYLDEEGEADGEPVNEELAIVRAENVKALNTIAAFELNTRYFDAERSELRIPRAAYLSMEDYRVHHRTVAWNSAVRATALLADAVEGPARGAMLDSVRQIASATGFWSVWATVLWNRFEDPDILRAVLMEPEENILPLLDLEPGYRASAEEVALQRFRLGPGPHQAFPGTRSDWIGS